MSDEARRELLTDWCARNRERGGRPEEYTRRVWERYLDAKATIHFHPETRAWVEARLTELSGLAAPPRAQ